MTLRVIVPDVHGSEADPHAVKAFLGDLSVMGDDVAEIIILGDFVDAGGWLSHFAPRCFDDLEYSYLQDIQAATEILDAIQKRCPKAEIHYLEGNHEQHCERWAVNQPALRRTMDAKTIADALAPHALLKLRERGIHFYSYFGFHHGLTVPNTIVLGDKVHCFFTHGKFAGLHATRRHLASFGANVFHGHNHIAQLVFGRTARDEQIMAACPGCLCKLQPSYTAPRTTEWTHGYDRMWIAKSGRFRYEHVPIIGGASVLGIGAAA